MQRVHHRLHRRERDIGCVQTRKDQQIGFVLERGMRVDTLAQRCRERGIAVHLAVGFQIGGDLLQDRGRLAHLQRACRIARAEIRMRQQRCLGRHAEATDLLGRQHRHLGDFLRGGIDGDVGVREEGDTALRDQHRERRQVAYVRPAADDQIDIAQMALEPAFEAADHRVGLVAHHGQRGDDRVVGAHHGARRFLGHAAASAEPDQKVDIVAVARIVLRIDDLEIGAGPDLEAVAPQAHVDNMRTADQDRLGDAFLQHNLCRAQHALVLAVGIDDTLGGGRPGGGEDGLHDQSRAEHEAREAVYIGRHVLDGPGGDTGLAGGLGDGGRDAQDQARIERRGNQEIGSEDRRLAGIGACRDVGRLLAGKPGNGAHGGHLHFLVDRRRADVERPPEDVREAEYVVDLVREIRAAGADHRVGPRLARDLGHDFGHGVCKRQDKRFFRHLLQQFRLENAGRRKAEEDVGAADHVGKLPRRRVLDVGVLPPVHLVDATLVGDAEAVCDPDIVAFRAERDEQIEAGKGGRTRT